MKLLLALAVLLLLTTPVVAQDYQKGVEAYERGDYATALRELRPLAEQSVAGAQYKLGAMYDKGRGVPKNYAKAVKWYRRAAEQGDAHGQYKLGLMYATGQGVPQDYVQARMWLNLAAAKGHKRANSFRDFLAERMTPADISKAQRMAREWLEAHPK